MARFLVELEFPRAALPHLYDECYECDTAEEAGVRAEDLCGLNAEEVTEQLEEGETVRWRDAEPHRELTVSPIEKEKS
jgi:hypothetical protein